MTEAKRRYTGQQFETIPAGGGWDEWFKVRTVVTMDDLAMVQAEEETDPTARASRMIDVVNKLAGRMVVGWSLAEPVSVQAFRALPYDMVQPVFTAVSSFLAKARSAQSSATTPSTFSNTDTTVSQSLTTTIPTHSSQ